MELVILALAPSVLWLWWFWHDGGRSAEAKLLSKSFIFGVLSAAVAWFIESKTTSLILTHALIPFIVIGPVEEVCKCTATYLALRGAKRDQAMTYAAAAALGFAFAENMGTLFGTNPATILLRSAISVPAHVLFTVPWAMALSHTHNKFSVRLLLGLALSAFLHGAVDSALFESSTSKFVGLIFCSILIAMSWMLYERRHTHHEAHRKFNFQNLWCPLKLDRIGFVFMIGLITSVIVAFLTQSNILQIPKYSPSIALPALIIGLFLAGFAGPFYFPDEEDSTRETAIGLALIGALAAAFFAHKVANVMEWSVAMAYLGGLGGWLGESLRIKNNNDD